MTKAAKAGVNASICALIAGQALHWFISGESADHSASRNAAVISQLIVALILVIQVSLQARKVDAHPR